MTVKEDPPAFGKALATAPLETEAEPEIGVSAAVAEPLSSDTKLDAATVALLSGNSFLIQQRVRWVEALTQGCFEQANIYDVFEKDTNRKLFIVQEESDALSRCCCAPEHSLFAKFYQADALGEKTGSAVMTMEREGCDCCFTGPCPKPFLCCFACKPGCADSSTFYAGDIVGRKAGEGSHGETTNLLGQSVQPLGGGGFKPVMQVMDRAGNDTEPRMFAATRGPCLFGGCSEFCVDSRFGMSVAKHGSTVKEIHQLPFGDFASITKIKPNSFGGALREAFTDSDIYEVTFHTDAITPQQKANILATMVHLDYMFFERDNDMCSYEGQEIVITCFNCFIYGCVCPCQCRINPSQLAGGGDGGGD